MLAYRKALGIPSRYTRAEASLEQRASQQLID